jgi:hypothetical protein
MEALKTAAHTCEGVALKISTQTIINRAMLFEEYILTGNNQAP